MSTMFFVIVILWNPAPGTVVGAALQYLEP